MSNSSIPISIVIPTYNSEGTMRDCLESVFSQTLSPDSFEVIVADGGSTDNTPQIAAKYGVRLIRNRLRTGEAGKAAGLKEARGELVVFLDSDNILADSEWLAKMVRPFEEEEKVLGAEPLEFTYRRKDPTISRYVALVGACDPLQLYVGNRDRWNWARKGWTDDKSLKSDDRGGYILVRLPKHRTIPTIGANGFVGRRSDLLAPKAQYYFDIDVVYDLVQRGLDRVAMVKTGVVHLHAGTAKEFVRKAHRRIRDYHTFRDDRTYPWSMTRKGVLKFCLMTVVVVPVAFESAKGYRRKPDRAWLFHPAACVLVLLTYALAIARILAHNVVSKGVR